jgi:hypothetical protein
MDKCLIEIKSNLVHQVNLAERRIQSIEWDQEEPYSDGPGELVHDNELRYRTHYRHLETGKDYLDFTGGVVWPFLKNQGALVVLGVLIPEQDQDIPALEVLEAELVESQGGLLENIRRLRIRYGARRNPNILGIWQGPTTAEQNSALGRFQEEAAGAPQAKGEARFFFTLPYQLDDPDFYRNTVQGIMEYLKPGQKRLTGLAGFSALQGELSNLKSDDLGARIENFPGVAALCNAVAGVNPAFNQAGGWEKAITRYRGREEW